MGIRDLTLAAVAKFTDRASGPAKRLAGVSGHLAEKLKESRDELRNLQQQAANVQTLQALNSKLNASSERLGAAQQKVKDLHAELANAKRAGEPVNKLKQQLDRAYSSANKLSDSHNQLRQRAGTLRKELKAAGHDTSKLASAQQTLKQKIEASTHKIDTQKKRLGLWGKATAKARDMQKGLWSAMKWSAGGVMAAGMSLSAGVGGGINTAATFESYQAVLETIEGSQAKASESMKWISDFATRTPSELSEVTEAFVRLRSYGLNPTNGLLGTLGDTSAAMGKPIMDAVEAIADAITGENERLKTFGIKARADGDLFKYEYTDRSGVQRTLVALKDDRKQIESVLTRIWNEKYGGASERQAKTWNGIMSNLSDQWARFQMLVMSSGPFEALKGHLGDLLDRIDKMAADGTLQAWAEEIGAHIMSAIDKVIGFGTALYDIITTMANFTQPMADFIGGWGNLALVLAGLKIMSVVASLGFLLNPIGLVVTAVSVLGLAVYSHWDKIKAAFAGGVASLLESVRGLLSALPNWVLPSSLESGNIDATIAKYRAMADQAQSKVGKQAAPIKPANTVHNEIKADIQITAAHGQNQQDIANAVVKEMEKWQRQMAAQNRSSLIDQH